MEVGGTQHINSSLHDNLKSWGNNLYHAVFK